jgi:hypothetical protein
MHMYSDANVDWQGIDDAAWFIADGLAKYGRIHISQVKEKYGTVRVYCSFGFDSFFGIVYPRRNWIPANWPWKWDLKVFGYIESIVNKIVVPLQKKYYRYRYAKAVRKWPHLKLEILIDADFGDLLDGIEGYKFSDYWTVFTEE